MKTTLIISAILGLAISAPAPISKRQNNLQTFTGNLGGIAATPIENSGDAKRPFQVKGDTFVNIGAAVQRSCDQQFNACANKANGGDKSLSVSACADQKNQCDAAGASITGAQAGANANANANANGNANANNNAGATGKACKANKRSVARN